MKNNMLCQATRICLLFLLFVLAACSEESRQTASGKGAGGKKAANQKPAYKAREIKSIPVKHPTSMSLREFAGLVFSALQKPGLSKQGMLLMNRNDLDYFYAMKMQYLKDNHATADVVRKEQVKASKASRLFARNRKTKLQALKKSYDRIREVLQKKGIDPDTAEFVGIHQEKMRAVYKVWQTDIFVTARSGKKHFVFKLPRIMRTRRGWVLTETLSMEGVSK